MTTLFRAIGSLLLFVVFFFVTGMVVIVTVPDVNPVIFLVVVLLVPFWLTRRIMRKRAAPPLVGAASVPKAEAGERFSGKHADSGTLEELEQARAQEPVLRWVDAAKNEGAKDESTKPGQGSISATFKEPWGKVPASPQPRVENPPDEKPPLAKSIGTARGWIPRGEQAFAAGRPVGDMVYIGPVPRGMSRGWIDPALPATAATRDKEGDDLPYWPSYADIPPRSRATYLDWLAQGRNDASYDPGYMFLYFYGLERRFLRDDPPEDERRHIVSEVRRLKDLYPASGSVQRYLGEFLQLAACMMEGVPDRPPPRSGGWDMDLPLRMALGARIADGMPLDADWLLAWLSAHPDRNLRTPARRCEPEFHAMFRVLFNRRFPQGLEVRKPRKVLKLSYRAASGEFDIEFAPKADGRAVPDILTLHQPVEIAQEIADEACDALDKFSRYLGRNPDGRGTPEGHALLPAELADAFPSAQMDALRGWARAIVEASGLVPVADLVTRLEGAPGPRLSRRQLTDAADALARIGFGLAPDPRFAFRAPRQDEPVVLFDLPEPVAKLEDVSDEFRNGLLQVALACIVAQADGRVTPEELAVLRLQIEDMAGISPSERLRLSANLEWFLAVPPDMSQLRGRIREVASDREASLRQAVVAIAHTDGALAATEVAGIERIYRTFGLDPDQAYSDLHAVAAADEPVPVKKADVQAVEEGIPPDRPASRLDAGRIAAIRADTARASALLGVIFVDADEEKPQREAAAAILPGLDQRHGALVRDLITTEKWSEAAFAELAGRHGLMPDGALETVNEWAHGRYEDALIEEYDGYEVSGMLAGRIASELAGKEA